MLALKELKNGGVAYIFGEDMKDFAKSLFPVIASKALGEQAFLHPKWSKTLDDVRFAIESGKQNKPQLKLSLNVPKTTSFVPADKAELKQEAHALIAELCAKDGLKFGLAWTKAYRILADSTGFDVYSVKPTVVRGKPCLIQTVIDHGKGGDFCRALRRYLDKH